MATIAYRFRLLRCVSEVDRVRVEIHSGHELGNDLVAIERRRRRAVQAYWAERGGYVPLLDALKTAEDDARTARKTLAKGDPDRDAAFAAVKHAREAVYEAERAAIAAGTDDSKARRKARAKELMEAAKARGEKMTAAQCAAVLDADDSLLTPRDRMRLQIAAEYAARGVAVSAKAMASRLREAGLVGPTDHIDQAAKAEAYDAYERRGVSPGTRAIVTEAHERSLAKLAGRPQKFRDWDGSGAFGVQTKPLSPADAAGGWHTMFRLEQMADRGNVRPGSRASGRLHLARVRIGSNGRSPLWADFECIVHRPIHPDAQIVSATVHVERVGVHEQWHLVLTANVPDAAHASPQSDDASGTVAVDIGWRSHEGDLRVGYWTDDRGGSGEICTPAMRGKDGKPCTMRDKYQHARSIQSLLDERFNAIVPELSDWLTEHADTLPEWLTERTRGLRQWRSQHRLNELVERWLSERFEGDSGMLGSKLPDERDDAVRVLRERGWEDAEALAHATRVLGPLDVWRRTWRHLEEWQDRERRHVLAARREHYRQVAVALTRRYKTIVINGADLAATRRRKPADKTDGLVMVEDLKRAQAFDAAPSELRECIVAAAKKRGVVVVKAKADTSTCHACGATCEFDRARHLSHECEHCGARWDQDLNACRNMLREWSGAPQSTGPARKKGKPAERRDKTEAPRARGRAAE